MLRLPKEIMLPVLLNVASNYKNTTQPTPPCVCVIAPIKTSEMYYEFMDIPKIDKYCASIDKKK